MPGYSSTINIDFLYIENDRNAEEDFRSWLTNRFGDIVQNGNNRGFVQRQNNGGYDQGQNFGRNNGQNFGGGFSDYIGRSHFSLTNIDFFLENDGSSEEDFRSWLTDRFGDK